MDAVQHLHGAERSAPGTVSYAYSPSQDVVGNQWIDSGRVNVVGNPSANVPAGLHAFNPAAFAPPAYQPCEVANPAFSCWGNAGKYLYRGPGINNLDISMFKNMLFGERWRAQLRIRGI